MTLREYAYTVSHKCGPMRATLLETLPDGQSARVRVTWEPTGVVTEREAPCRLLRPWTAEDTVYWQERRIASQVKRAKEVSWRSSMDGARFSSGF